MQHIGQPGRLHASYAVELQTDLREAVQRVWRRRQEGEAQAPHLCLAANVWDLCTPTSESMERLVREIPPSALVLIVAGSPCQQLT
eukprot:12898340-Prorocentrum_lima.AAC.1